MVGKAQKSHGARSGMADVLMGFHRSTFSKPNTEFNSYLVTRLGGGRPGFGFVRSTDLFSSIPALGPTQPPTQWVLGGFFTGGKATGA
jgi:hypothetical protein